MEIGNCESCKFYDINMAQSICRRYPPRVISRGDELIQVVTHTDKSEWCGEWKERG